MLRAFKVICSEIAAAALKQSECTNIIQRVIELAQQRDRGVHEGMAFAFDMHGQEWEIVVDLQEGWVKIMRKDEFEKGMRDAIQKN